MDYGTQLFNETLKSALAVNKRFLYKRSAYIPAFLRIASNIKKSTKIRGAYERKEGLIVPPVLILSVTNDCNLKCFGCYACSQQRDKSKELDSQQLERIVGESASLGVAVVMIAGGEPLLKPGLLELPKKYPQLPFIMFTNGLLLRGDTAESIGRIKNLIPVISLEGGKERTDVRRGAGVFDTVMETMRRLDSKKRLFGVSVTLTSANYEEVICSDYLEKLQNIGCRAAFLIEYVPCGAQDESLCLTEQQKQHLRDNEKSMYESHDMLIVTLPGNEEPYGGCLASGRGFLHISSGGALEACPFAPYSDVSVADMPLKEALCSPLLKKIRENHSNFKESRGGCALKENAEWVSSLKMQL